MSEQKTASDGTTIHDIFNTSQLMDVLREAPPNKLLTMQVVDGIKAFNCYLTANVSKNGMVILTASHPSMKVSSKLPLSTDDIVFQTMSPIYCMIKTTVASLGNDDEVFNYITEMKQLWRRMLVNEFILLIENETGKTPPKDIINLVQQHTEGMLFEDGEAHSFDEECEVFVAFLKTL